MINLERLQAAHRELQALSATVANEELAESQRELARKKTVELANQIAAIAEKGDAPVYVVNLNRKRFTCARSYGSYMIIGRGHQLFFSNVIFPMSCSRQAGASFSATRRGGADIGVRYYHAREIAEDLCREINSDLLPLGVASTFTVASSSGPTVRKTQGTFVSDSSIPPKEQLKKEIEDLKRYYSAMVDEGDAIFAKTQDRKQLSGMHFEAAEYLSIQDREWTMNLDLITCPGCSSRINRVAAVCYKCGWVLDAARVADQQALKQKLNLVPAGK